MMKFARISLVAVVAFVAAGVASYADDTFEYKGYMRIGSQLNMSGNAPDAFGIKNAQKWTGRLGNEDQSRPAEDPFFLEQTFIKNWTHENGSFAKAVVLLNYHGKPVGDNGDYVGESYPTKGDPSKGQDTNSSLRIRQAYVEMGGFAVAPNTTFWAGKRFLNRQDVFMLDWFYLDFSGNGAGVTNIAGLGLDVAYIQRLGNTKVDDAGSVSKGTGRLTSNNLVVKYENTLVRVDANVNTVSNGSDKAGKKTMYSSQMASVTFKPEKFFYALPGQSSVVLQYANGGQANCMWYGNRFTNNVEDGWQYNKDTDAMALVAMATGLATINDVLNINPVLAYRYYSLDRTKVTPSAWGGGKVKWESQNVTAGARTTYNINANIAACLELGYTMSKCDNVAGSAWGNTCGWAGLPVEKNDEWSGIYKIAPSLVLTMDSGYWTRPQIRLGYVYTAGDKAYKTTGTGSNKNEDSAQWLFVQAEAWW